MLRITNRFIHISISDITNKAILSENQEPGELLRILIFKMPEEHQLSSGFLPHEKYKRSEKGWIIYSCNRGNEKGKVTKN